MTKPKEPVKDLAEKEARGLSVPSPFDGRAPRPAHPDPEVPAEVDKREWKESRDRHPSRLYEANESNADRVVEPEPEPEPMTPDEIFQKEARGRGLLLVPKP